jgi:hypothetical protein
MSPLEVGSIVQIPRNQFGPIWSKLNPSVGPCFLTVACILSSPFGSFLLLLSEPIDFPSKMVPCRLVLDSQLKAVGPIYGSRPIGLLYFIGPSSKAALISVEITFDTLKWLKNFRVRVSCSLARSLGSRSLPFVPVCASRSWHFLFLSGFEKHCWRRSRTVSSKL